VVINVSYQKDVWIQVKANVRSKKSDKPAKHSRVTKKLAKPIPSKQISSRKTKKPIARATIPRPRKLKTSSVVALVPAHNEEDIITETIASLMNQTLPLKYVLIIADNCTDNTTKIVKKLQKDYGADRLRLMKTRRNKFKKAGALNQGFNSLIDRPKYIFGMDADSILDSKIIEAGVRQFKREPNTAGICSAYRTLPLKHGSTRWQKYLWRIQNIEFGLANAWRVEN